MLLLEVASLESRTDELDSSCKLNESCIILTHVCDFILLVIELRKENLNDTAGYIAIVVAVLGAITAIVVLVYEFRNYFQCLNHQSFKSKVLFFFDNRFKP